MGYKVSKYNMVIKQFENGDVLLFNTRISALGVMKKNIWEFLNQIEKYSEEEIIKNIGPEEFAVITKNGFVLNKDINELDLIKMKSQNSKFNSNGLSLTIAPTLNCNMRCPYCYEDKKNIRMGEDITVGLVRFVKKYLQDMGCKNLYITWYGGEPLLELTKILSLSQEFIDICNELGVKYSAYIITNGVLLTKETALILKEKCMVHGAQITVDGTGEIHNKRRILVNKDDSFNVIMNNIEMCKKILNIGVRMNVDSENYEDIYQFVDELVDIRKWGKKPQFYFALTRDYGNTDHFKDNKCLELDDYQKLNRKYLEKRADSLDIKELIPKTVPNFCGAVRQHAYVIDPEGNIYKCWNMIGKAKEKIGNVLNYASFNKEIIRWINYEPSGKCLECNLLPLCMGGCPYLYFSKQEHICDSKVSGIEEKLYEAYKLWKKNNLNN